MRIAIVSNTSWYLWNFRKSLIDALREAGHEVLAVAPEDAFSQKLIGAGIEFAHLPLVGDSTNPLRELASVFQLQRIFVRHRIDAVFSYTPKGNLYAGLACMRTGATFVPNVSGLGSAFIKQSLVTKVACSLYRTTFARAHRVMFQNHDDLAYFTTRKLTPVERSERLPGSGVDLSRFSADIEGMDEVCARPADAPVFLMVARIMWDKGVGEYVEAASRVRRHYPKARFRLLGGLSVDNPTNVPREFLDEWQADGRIEYLGSTEDVRPYLAGADCVVLPSYREGVPRTLLEAAAMSRPVITSDAVGCRDAVIDGQTGLKCRVRDAADLTDKMMQFLALPKAEREKLGRNGRAFVEREFDERFVIDRYLHMATEISGVRGIPLPSPQALPAPALVSARSQLLH